MDGKIKAQSLCVLVRVFFWRWELFWSPKKWRKKIFGLIYMVAHKCVVLNFYGAKVIVIFILTRRYLNMKFNLFNRQIIELLAIWITFEAPLWVMWLQFCHMARKSRPENAIIYLLILIFISFFLHLLISKEFVYRLFMVNGWWRFSNEKGFNKIKNIKWAPGDWCWNILFVQ